MSLRGIIISSSDPNGRSQTTRIPNSLDSGGISKKAAQNMYDFFLVIFQVCNMLSQIIMKIERYA